MAKKIKNRCYKSVPSKGLSMHFHQCTRKGKFLEEGKWWCETHAPSYVKARRDIRTAFFEAEQDSCYEEWKEMVKKEGLKSKRSEMFPELISILRFIKARRLLDSSPDSETISVFNQIDEILTQSKSLLMD